MTTLREMTLSTTQLALAVQTKSPYYLAQTFAGFVGQFYDRLSFDAMAREVEDLYRIQRPEQAGDFRMQLDHRLHDRYHAPVAWDIAPVSKDQAA